ncbi:WbbJ Acetyltransferase (isoleucine patch superfamily) [uncultured Caudovirales phage]|uniref:WbbJ Acetyltransferase (Isoleucine patch superfamily) n=1 Tax=uncultured Caudovirales phage TaxID=2100421 RepID=A0A6J5KP19_9CAUD|nr:WbbJ Acetyltransferase (isoleucine patch superfamily) [uncultured Caudovirales phage]CAB4124028.1 WbbJ Acetyltransferase (isoleucine patch superfamily) [uncultured Caudovirales phage]CAB5219693.1 WbbJ Acetyltransferase (isoleucine patch superfamily) [uncultured Caudovirales phage]
MKIDVIGRGKLSWLVEDILTKDKLRFFDDTVKGVQGTKESDGDNIFVSIGNNAYRKELFEFYKARNIISVISELSFVSSRSIIGAGAFINNFSSVHTNAKLGLGCFIHPNSIIDVGATVGDFCRIGSQVYIGENVKIGNNCILASGVNILPNITIGDNCHICAGTVVNRSFGDDETIVGYPARSVKGNNELHRRE